MESLGLTYNVRTNRTYLFWAVAGSLFCTGLALWSPVSLAFVAGAVFVGLFLSSRTVRWMVFPTVLILNQYIFTNSGLPFQIGRLFIQPIDWIAILLILSTAFRQILTSQPVWVRTGLELPIGAFLAAVAASLFWAQDLAAGIINWGHTALYFVAFYAMVTDWKDVPLERIWKVYLFWAFLAATSALWQFFASGGGRGLGFARLTLNAVVLPVMCLGLARLSVEPHRRNWFLILAFVATAVASQTRGLWLSLGVLLTVWLFSGRVLEPVRLTAARRHANRVLQLALAVLLILFLLAPFLGEVERRAEQLVQQGGTVYLRFFLWGQAWQLFLENPVFGIGMGQFDGVVEQFPEMKNLAVFELTRGLSAHNLILTFLSETGVVGTLGFFGLLAAVVRFAWRGIQRVRTVPELAWGWGLFLVATVFCLSFLFAGVWDYHFTFFMALLVLFVRRLEFTPGGADER